MPRTAEVARGGAGGAGGCCGGEPGEAGSADGRGGQGGAGGVCCNPRAVNKIKNAACSNWIVGLALITTFAVTVLALLAVIGNFYPTSALGVFAGNLTPAGTYIMLAAGLSLFATCLIARCCCARNTTPQQRLSNS